MRVAAAVTPRWTRKPDPGTDLDRDHVLCPDHCWPFLGPQGRPQLLARRTRVPTSTQVIYAGNQTIVPGRKYGWAVRHGSVSDQLRLADTPAAVDTIVPTGAGGFTVLIGYRKTDATARASTAIGIDGNLGSADSMLLCLPYSDSTAVWRWSSAGANDIIVASLTYGDDLWIATTGPRGMELWQNGLKRGSNAATPSRSATTGSFTFGSPAGTPNFADLADLAVVMTWRRQLPAAAIRSLSINPWQVFQPPTGLVVSAPVAPPTVPVPFPALTLAP